MDFVIPLSPLNLNSKTLDLSHLVRTRPAIDGFALSLLRSPTVMIVIRVPLSIERIKPEENIPILTLSISLKVKIIAYSNSTMSGLTLNTIPNNERNHTNDSHNSNRNHPVP